MIGSPPPADCIYRAYISYSHRDKAWADWLHRSLETYRVPSRLVGAHNVRGVIPRRLNPIFRDREELASATDLGSKVNEALAQSENLIVICSPAAATSRWVNEEVLTYMRLGRGDRIFCLLIGGEPNASLLPGREAEECFCPALRFTVDAAGQPLARPAEPIAADARAGKDGKRNAKLKLIAGMLDVRFDALKQREQHRRMVRMTAITALAVSVMAVTIVLAIFALVSRDHAVSARHAAVRAQQAAVRRQKHAEDLVNFMLGDLTTRLRQVDRLDILSSVDDKALAYFKSLPISDVNATTLAQRARTLQKIGDVRMDQARLADSMDAFQQALRINRQLAREAPDSAKAQDAYGQNLLWVGYNDWMQGRLDRAEANFKHAATAVQRAASLAPNDNDVAKDLDFILNNLGNVAVARGELASAHTYFNRDFALDQRMAKQYPDEVLWQNALGAAWGNLANVALAQGDLATTIADDFRQQQVLAKVVAHTPSNRQMQSQLEVDDGVLARVLGLAGQTQAAIGYSQAAVRIGASLIAFDPTHADWRDDHAFHSRQLGRLLLTQGDVEGAGKALDVALTTDTQLVAKDPSNAEWRSELARAELDAARLALARKQPDVARKLASQGAANVQQLLTGGSPNPDLIRIDAGLDLLMGQLAADANGAAPAGKQRAHAVALLRPVITHSADPRDLALWVEALLASGDRAQALPVVARLQQMGYRPAGFAAALHALGIDYPANHAFDQRITSILATPDHDLPPTP